MIDDPCGDGVQIFNACDDGNTVSGDGCSATCNVEEGYVCPIAGEPCRQPRCGDGYQDSIFLPEPAGPGDGIGGGTGSGGASGSYYYESCDDGNTVSGDGCSATCQVEEGYLCSTPGEACRQPRCGDGIADSYFVGYDDGAAGAGAFGVGGSATGAGGDVASGGSAGAANYVYESCDDGNTVSGDGCDATCETEPGYVCPSSGGACREPRCGDGVVDYYYPGEVTGAGGAPGDGSGGAMATAGSAGAGGTGPVEQCDDGNNVSGDGCSATCTVE